MSANTKRIDLLAAYNKRSSVKRKSSSGFRVVLIVLLVLIFAAEAALYVMMKRETDALTIQTMDVYNELALSNYEELAEQNTQTIELLSRQLSANEVMQLHLDVLENTYRVDSGIYGNIEYVAAQFGITLSGFSYTNGLINVNCSSVDPPATAEFAKALEQDLISGVTYVGYQWSESGQCYVFTVQGTRKGA